MRRYSGTVPRFASRPSWMAAVVATAPESTAAPEITATEIASNPALQGEISSYETDRMLELGTDSAAESMDKTEQQAGLVEG